MSKHSYTGDADGTSVFPSELSCSGTWFYETAITGLCVGPSLIDVVRRSVWYLLCWPESCLSESDPRTGCVGGFTFPTFWHKRCRHETQLPDFPAHD